MVFLVGNKASYIQRSCSDVFKLSEVSVLNCNPLMYCFYCFQFVSIYTLILSTTLDQILRQLAPQYPLTLKYIYLKIVQILF